MSKLIVNLEAILDTAAAQAGLDRFRADADRNPVNERIKLDSADAKAQLLDLRATLDKTIGKYSGSVDLNTKQALASALKLRTQLDRELGKTGIEVDLKTDRLDAQLADMDAKVAAATELAGGEGGKSFISGFSDVMSPQVLIPAIAVGLALLPGAFAVAGAAGAAALGVAFAVKGSPALQSAAKGLLGDLESTMEGAASVLDKPIAGAIDLIKADLPAIGSLFSTTFADVGPDLAPMVTMLDDLVKDTLPGFNLLMKDSQGPLKQFFDTAGAIVGTGFSQFLSALAPAVGPSLTDFELLLKTFVSLLPAIADTAGVLANVLEPVFKVVSAGAGAANDALTKYQGTGVIAASQSHSIWDQVTGFVKAVVGMGPQTAPSMGMVKNNFAAVYGSANVTTASVKGTTAASNLLVPVMNAVAKALDAAASKANNAWLKQANLNSVLGTQVGLSSTLVGNTETLSSKLTAEQSAVSNLTGAWDLLNGVTGNAQQSAQSYASAFNTLVADQKSGTVTSTQLWGDWNNLSQAAETNIDKMTTLGSATDATTKTQKFAHKAVLDSISGLVVAAGSNAAYQQSAIQVAAQNGFTGTTFSQLKAWVDKNGGSMNDLKSDTDKASGSLSNAQTKALDAGGSFGTLSAAISKAGQDSGLTKGQVDDLTAGMKDNKNHVDDSNSSFDTFAAKLGISKQKANDLWAKLKNVAGNYAANVKVNVSGGGTVSASVKILDGTGVLDPTTPAAVASVNAQAKAKSEITLPGKATGGVIPGGIHGRDSVPIMAAPGELIVPSSHAPAFKDMARRAGIPMQGFAAGGITWPLTPSSGFSQAASVNNSLAPIAEPGFANRIGDTVASQLAAALKTGLISAQQAALAAASNGAPGGPFAGGPASLLTIAKYLMANGFNRGAAAGIAATIDGESGGNPESRGDGGWGLIGWTGNVVGLPAGYTGPTGNVQFDLGKQLQGVVGYANARGGKGPLNAAGNISAVQAGDVWSSYEAPAVRDSDTRPSVANALYAELGSSTAVAAKAVQTQKQVSGKVNQVKPFSAGGMVSEPVFGFGKNSGIPYSFAENGPEMISPASDTNVNPGAPGATQYGQQQVVKLLGQLVQLMQQQPYAMARVQQNGLGAGMRRGMNSTGG